MMAPLPSIRSAWLLLAASALGCGSPDPELLPPLGEVVLSIDTDAPVPDFVGRLRIDAFDADGRWLDSSDFPRTDVRDWPASFSVYTRDEKTPREVLVRARAYLEGRDREYRGERFAPRTPYVEPHAADTLAELCADMPTLELGRPLTMRRGTRTLTGYVRDEIPPGEPPDYQTECWAQGLGGVVAARLVVTQAATYRIETTRVDPATADPSLFIRADCRDPLSQVACNDDISRDLYTPDYRSRLVLRLEPGSYTVLSGSYLVQASDVTLRADLADHWQADAPESNEEPPNGGQPRLLKEGRDRTPTTEPEPLVTIDRLVRLTVEPGRKQRASVVLRTTCGGTMAKLSAAGSDAAPVLTEAETCVDREGERSPVTNEPLEPYRKAEPSSVASSFEFGETCSRAGAQDGRVCVPGGHVVLGSPSFYPYPLSTVPERFALMRRYWLDETEVTVGRFRAAVARGFQPPDTTPIANDQPLDQQWPGNFIRHCTYSRAARSGADSRERFPLNCVDWLTARAFCRFEGGDLPSEAQWQYAATKAGRTRELDDLCDLTAEAPGACLPTGLVNVAAVDDPQTAADVTPLGVRGLAGNVSEWTRDSFQPLDGPCWNGATLVDPSCTEQNALERTVVGGSFTTYATIWRNEYDPSGAVQADDVYAALGDVAVGFRCAYSEAAR